MLVEQSPYIEYGSHYYYYAFLVMMILLIVLFDAFCYCSTRKPKKCFMHKTRN